jgi:hypothetical protein
LPVLDLTDAVAGRRYNLKMASDSLERAAQLPSLREFHVPLATLSEPESADLDTAVAALAGQLGPVSEPITLRVEVDGEARKLTGDQSGWRAGDEPATVEIIVDAGTWRELVTGRLSALDAFGRGRMRVRGDIGEARRLARALSGSGE